MNTYRTHQNKYDNENTFKSPNDFKRPTTPNSNTKYTDSVVLLIYGYKICTDFLSILKLIVHILSIFTTIRPVVVSYHILNRFTIEKAKNIICRALSFIYNIECLPACNLLPIFISKLARSDGYKVNN